MSDFSKTDRVLQTGEPDKLRSNAEPTQLSESEAEMRERQATAEKVDDIQAKTKARQLEQRGDLAGEIREELEQKYQEENEQWQEQSLDVTRDRFKREAREEADETHTAELRPPHPLEP